MAYSQIDSIGLSVTYSKDKDECKKNSIPFNEEKILNSIQKLDTGYQACCYHQLGVHFRNSDFVKAIKYYEEAIKLRSAINDKMLGKSNYNLGVVYKDIKNPKKSLRYFEEAYTMAENLDHKGKINLLIGLLEGYKEVGDLSKAYEYGKLILKFAKDEREEAEANVYLCEVLIEMEDSLETARSNAKSAKRKFSSNEEWKYKSIADALNCEAIASKKLELHEKALELYDTAYQKSYGINLNGETKSAEFRSNILNNISIVYKEQKKYNKAIQKLNQSLGILEVPSKQKYKHEYSAKFENLGDTYAEMDSFERSLVNYQKSLINLTNKFRNEDIYQNPDPKDTSLFIYSNPHIIRVLHLKATAAFKYYEQNNNQKYLNLGEQTYRTVFDFHDQLQKDISTENSRLFQAKNIVPYIENALKVAFQQQENGQDVSETAFRFMEKNKATVLLQSMNEADALQFANLPDSLLEQEKDLKIAITFHKKQLNDDAIEYVEKEEIGRLDKILFDEKQRYAQLINNLENNYPDYYRLKYKQNQTQLKEVQNQLDDKTALLEYFVGDSSIYVLMIQKEHSKLYQVKKPIKWKQTISNFRQSITNVNQDLPELFAENASKLYQLLLNEPLCDLSEDVKSIQIIPDAELNYIPFEILLTEAVDNDSVLFKELPYLFKEKTIGYAYSAALLLENKKTVQSQKTYNYGSYAPVYYEGDPTFDDLLIARETVTSLANSLNGQAFTNEQANLYNFINNTNSYKILHLAMHGVLNDKNPLSSYLAFTKKDSFKLHAYDLYNQKINTELTILHACNTGSGELQKGEGVMSLSRAFTYAGCPSLVMSLWSIPEEATSEITSSFIRHLKNGLAKDVSLQKAKLAYLQNQPERLASPAYWAGLVATGNLKPINFD